MSTPRILAVRSILFPRSSDEDYEESYAFRPDENSSSIFRKLALSPNGREQSPELVGAHLEGYLFQTARDGCYIGTGARTSPIKKVHFLSIYENRALCDFLDRASRRCAWVEYQEATRWGLLESDGGVSGGFLWFPRRFLGFCRFCR